MRSPFRHTRFTQCIADPKALKPSYAAVHPQVTVLRVFNRIMGDTAFLKSPAGHEARC